MKIEIEDGQWVADPDREAPEGERRKTQEHLDALQARIDAMTPEQIQRFYWAMAKHQNDAFLYGESRLYMDDLVEEILAEDSTSMTTKFTKAIRKRNQAKGRSAPITATEIRERLENPPLDRIMTPEEHERLLRAAGIDVEHLKRIARKEQLLDAGVSREVIEKLMEKMRHEAEERQRARELDREDDFPFWEDDDFLRSEEEEREIFEGQERLRARGAEIDRKISDHGQDSLTDDEVMELVNYRILQKHDEAIWNPHPTPERFRGLLESLRPPEDE